MKHDNGEDVPSSTDLEGWKRVAASGRLPHFRLEHLVAAFQDLGTQDRRLYENLAKHLSNAIIGILTKRVGNNRPNHGQDIISDAHGAIFEALLKPKTKAGQALRTHFGPQVNFRMLDALANSMLGQVTMSEKRFRRGEKAKSEPTFRELEDGALDAQAVLEVDSASSPHGETKENTPNGKRGKIDGAQKGLVSQLVFNINDVSDVEDSNAEHTLIYVTRSEDDDVGFGKSDRDQSNLGGPFEQEQMIDVKRILMSIPDIRKRLAFVLHMEQVPADSKKVKSIARACGVNEKTAREWIDEVVAFLRSKDAVNELRELKSGAKP